MSLADVRVVDGDTLDIDGVVYRLNGIDAPEHGQTCGDWQCGVDATAELADLVEDRKITCDAISEDGYGRVIATCFVDGRDLGAAMVEQGMAWAFVKYSETYLPEELVSRDKAIGVFSKAFEPPWLYRESRWKSAVQTAPGECVIKGNISTRGRIYHSPWSPWYDRTRINLKKGERWFCTEAEAVAAGWRAPYWN